MIVDARHANPCLVLANATARRVLTPAVSSAASLIGAPLLDWLPATEHRLVTEALGGLSKLRPSARRTLAWPFIWGDLAVPTRFRLLDWDPGQALVTLTFAAAPLARDLVPRPASGPSSVRPRTVSAIRPAEVLPKGVAAMAGGLSAAPPALPARMRRSEDLLRATMANTDDTLLFLDTSLTVRFINKPHEGRSPEKILGRSIAELLPLSTAASLLARLQRLLVVGGSLAHPFDWIDAAGQARYHELRAAPVHDVGVGMGVCVSIRDMTELRRLERELMEASALERQRIGRDLHDGLGQDLTGVALMMRALATRLERECPAAAQSAGELVRLVNHTLESARSLAHGLLPVSRERGGLVGALRALANRTSEIYGLEVRCRAEIWPELQLSETEASELYRIAQEALTNVARHAHATRVRLSLHVNRRRYCLKIADDGVGLPRARVASSGMGLKIMAHRAALLGAKLTIARNPPSGTLIRVTGAQMPLRSGV
ncbi:MAG: PAS domain-containing protein [Gammaproteobacteria bacterium]|nr:PAS domain-containing protein [Gammaproteobacteria bacterium]